MTPDQESALTKLGVVGGGVAVGMVAAGAAATVLGRRFAAFRRRDEEAEETFGPYSTRTAPAALPGGGPEMRSRIVVATDGVPLQVEEVGPADAEFTAVFVHGYCLSAQSWYFQRSGFAPRTGPDLRLVFYDQRGHGESGWGEPDLATIDQIADDLAHVLDEVVPTGPVALVGHSMGGITIMGLAESHPELFGARVVAVGLLSTSTGNLAEVGFGLPQALTGLGAAVLPVVAKLARSRPRMAERTRRIGKDISFVMTRRMSFARDDLAPGLAAFADRIISATPVEVIAAFYPTLAGLDKSGVLEPLRRVRTLILCGDTDRMTPQGHSERLAEELPDAELVIVESAGHLAMLEYPELVNEHLSELIEHSVPARP